MSEWINVKDRLPEPNTEVLVYIKYPQPVLVMDRGIWKKDNIKKLFFDGKVFASFDYGKLSHWMPLPQKPESEDDAEDGCMKEANEGEWIVHYNDIFPIESTEECSICHAEQYINGNDDNYCPNCGVKMKQT